MGYDWLRAEGRNVYSQFGEDGVIEAILRVIKPANQWCFECGAADGLFFSNTRRMVKSGWDALLVEADHDTYRRLAHNCAPYPNARLVCETAVALDPLLSAHGVPSDIDLVVIDVDGQDYHLFNSMLRYRPRVVVMEFDQNVDPYFIPEIGGSGQAGIEATRRLASGRYYTEVYRNPCNLILVKSQLAPLLDMEMPK